MAFTDIHKHIRSMGMKGPSYNNTNLPGDGVCARPDCGWHAELNDEGFCLTRECRRKRAVSVNVYTGNTPEQADTRMLLAQLLEENRQLRVKAQKQLKQAKVILSNFRK